MVAHTQGQEVPSEETVPLGARTSLSLQSRPEEPQLTLGTAQQPHSIGETGEGQDFSGAEHIPSLPPAPVKEKQI